MKKILKITTDNKIKLLETQEHNSIYNAISKDMDSALDHFKTKKLGQDYYIIVSDDGYSRSLPVNYVGSDLYNNKSSNWHLILGDIYIVKDNSSSYDGLTDEDILYLLKILIPG